LKRLSKSTEYADRPYSARNSKTAGESENQDSIPPHVETGFCRVVGFERVSLFWSPKTEGDSI